MTAILLIGAPEKPLTLQHYDVLPVRARPRAVIAYFDRFGQQPLFIGEIFDRVHHKPLFLPCTDHHLRAGMPLLNVGGFLVKGNMLYELPFPLTVLEEYIASAQARREPCILTTDRLKPMRDAWLALKSAAEAPQIERGKPSARAPGGPSFS